MADFPYPTQRQALAARDKMLELGFEHVEPGVFRNGDSYVAEASGFTVTQASELHKAMTERPVTV